MKRLLLPLFAFGLAIGLFAGTGSEVGSATVTEDAQVVTVNFWIKSQCYETPAQAQEANDCATTDVLTFLGQYVNKDSKIDKIFHEGGEASDYQYNPYGTPEEKAICKNTFEKTTQITWVTDNVDKFSSNFAAIQAAALAKFSLRGNNANSNVALTFAVINKPQLDVKPETRVEMEKLARANATQNAHQNFWICAQQCGIPAKNIKVVGINTPKGSGYDSHIPEKALYSAPGSSAPNFSFRKINVSATVEVTYDFVDSDFSSCLMQCKI